MKAAQLHLPEVICRSMEIDICVADHMNSTTLCTIPWTHRTNLTTCRLAGLQRQLKNMFCARSARIELNFWYDKTSFFGIPIINAIRYAMESPEYSTDKAEFPLKQEPEEVRVSPRRMVPHLDAESRSPGTIGSAPPFY